MGCGVDAEIKQEKKTGATTSHANKAGAMQLVGCDRTHEEITRKRTKATTPRESMPKRHHHRAGGGD
jgi:hypothetical protein